MSPAPKKPPVFNLNSALALLTITGIAASGLYFLAPLKTLPDDMRGVRNDMNEVQRVQAVQTQALQTLAEVARDNRELRRDFDRTTAEQAATIKRHDLELDAVRHRLERLESAR
ncbi:hypothetical protein [Luteolibacter sp. LG18]|uniref:hypothetical protein n=1 Tax=Luteolibacter sp. LG18 TaxID=2819286 RepID=UPI002B2E30D9|nr:hypothetical protein llg_25920 [Luteolibacter sp. LG18]